MLPLRAKQGDAPELVSLETGSSPLKAELVRLASRQAGWVSELAPEFSDRTPEDHPVALYRTLLDEDDNLSFEPGGQLEFSSKPYPCLNEAVDRIHEVQTVLDEGLRENGIELLQMGANPWHTVNEIGLQMNKPRYQAMNDYFAAIGEYGQRMMRQTCTIQVNLDFGRSEEELSGRYLLAQLLAPLATSIFANSPWIDGKNAGAKSIRARCWHDVDSSRTGFPKLERVAEERSIDSVIDSYLDYALAARVVFVEELAHKPMLSPLTFGQWLDSPVEGVAADEKAWETHLSLLFPEVRPRGFLELRSIDCQARAWQSVPASFYCGLFYDSKVAEKALDLLLPHLGEGFDLWKRCIHGLEDERIYQLVEQVVALATDGFSALPTCFRDRSTEMAFDSYLNYFTHKRRTPADVLIDRVPSFQSNTELKVLQQVQDEWNAISEGNQVHD